MFGFSVNDTLGIGSLTSSTSYCTSDNGHTGNTLVSESASFLGTTRTSDLLNVGLHTSLPHTNTGKESKNIGALLLLQFSQVSVSGRHLCVVLFFLQLASREDSIRSSCVDGRVSLRKN
jgi:hypothetical protein